MILLLICFNRNIVECKYSQALFQIFYNIVLIETLWNVNHIAEFLFHINCWVLIETLWNVNKKKSRLVKHCAPF